MKGKLTNKKNIRKEKEISTKHNPSVSSRTANHGITLVALVVTIVVLLILAGITITLVFSENGIINKAINSKEANEIATGEETIGLEYNSYILLKYQGETSKTFLEYLEDNNYIVDYYDESKEIGTVIVNDRLYEVDTSSGDLGIKYLEKASEETLLKPKITKIDSEVTKTTIEVTVEVENTEELKLKYIIQEDGKEEIIEETEETEDLQYKFENLEKAKVYIVTIEATNKYGTRTRTVRIGTEGAILVQKITFDRNQKTIMTRMQLNAKVEPENADNKTLIWTSSDDNIATVSEDGLVTPISNGDVVITCSSADGGATKTCNIKVDIAIPIINARADTIDQGNIYSDNTDAVINALFNGNTNDGGGCVGVRLSPGNSCYIEIEIENNIVIYAYGHFYTDGSGDSGKNLVVQKYNGTSYEAYKTCETKADGNRYELVRLEPGRYKMTPESRYVNFDEWEIEILD